VPISLGELFNKISIPELKSELLQEHAQQHARQELLALSSVLDGLQLSIDPLLVDQLKVINRTLWALDEEIRALEKRQSFGDHFVQVARSIYRENDQRAVLKRTIHTRYGSALIEEKSYCQHEKPTRSSCQAPNSS
jgi:hypothetical protein